MAGHVDRGVFGWRWPRTPVTPSGLHGMDQLPPEEALVRAWTVPGRNPAWHRLTVRVVRDAMPLLARALDRLAEDR